MFYRVFSAETNLMPGIEKFVIFESAVGGPPGRDIDIRILGDDLSNMKQAAMALRNELRALPGLLAV